MTCEAFAFGYAVDNMKANGTNAVSVVLRGADDTLGYRSETAIHMKRQADDAVAENAGTEISYLHENGMYVCGVFRVLSAGLDGQAKSAEEYYERSLAAEIAGNGIDAILFDGLNFDGENESTSLAYLAALRRDTGDTAIGAVLPAEFFRNGNAEATLRATSGRRISLRSISAGSATRKSLPICSTVRPTASAPSPCVCFSAHPTKRRVHGSGKTGIRIFRFCRTDFRIAGFQRGCIKTESHPDSID